MKHKINFKRLVALILLYMNCAIIAFTAIIILCSLMIEAVCYHIGNTNKELYYSRLTTGFALKYGLIIGAFIFIYAILFGKIKVSNLLYKK